MPYALCKYQSSNRTALARKAGKQSTNHALWAVIGCSSARDAESGLPVFGGERELQVGADDSTAQGHLLGDTLRYPSIHLDTPSWISTTKPVVTTHILLVQQPKSKTDSPANTRPLTTQTMST
jgi:hypothetical protein